MVVTEQLVRIPKNPLSIGSTRFAVHKKSLDIHSKQSNSYDIQMARGFSLQDINCLTLEGSIQQPVSSGQRQQAMQEQHDSERSEGGGIISSGLWWLDKQRERRRREHLQLEAEKQLQKIGVAQRAALRESSSGGNSKTSVAEESTSSSLFCQGEVVSTGSFGISESGSSLCDCDGVNTKNQKNQYLAHSSVSKSGEGASGMLFLNDIDEICGGGLGGLELTLPETEKCEKEETKILKYYDDEIIAPVRVTPSEGDDESPYILTQMQMNEISKHVLPEGITYCPWRRLYGLNRDGDSFDGCLRIIGSAKRTLMVVRTTKGDVFGGYADTAWHSRQESSTAHFHGSACSCLYSFSSTRTSMSTSSSPESSSINVYRWTGKNRYIQVCDVSGKMLAFGGGGDKGAFGLCLQENFERGTTGHCDTFDNDPLCSGEDRTFDVVDLEFWEFQTGVF